MCPSNCSCQGYSMACSLANLNSIPHYSDMLKALNFSGNDIKLTNDSFVQYANFTSVIVSTQ